MKYENEIQPDITDISYNMNYMEVALEDDSN
jgi:hypothetical protein